MNLGNFFYGKLAGSYFFSQSSLNVEFYAFNLVLRIFTKTNVKSR